MMFFLPRVNPLVALVLVMGVILMLVFELDAIACVLSGITCVFLVLAVLFNLYEDPKR